MKGVRLLDTAAVEDLKTFEAGSDPVLSVYLSVRPGDSRGMAARLKDLLNPLRDAGPDDREWSMSLRSEIDAVIAMADRLGAEAGKGIALFRCSARRLDVQLAVSDRVRDRAIVDVRPYVAPIEAMLDYYRHYVVVLLDGNSAEAYRLTTDTFEPIASFVEEDVRKANYGGFGGYEEHRVRGHAEEVRSRLHREVASDAAERVRHGADGLIVAGTHDHIASFLNDAGTTAKIIGSFVVDPHTATPAILRANAIGVAEQHRADEDQAGVERVLDVEASGGLAVVGTRAALNAVNQRAVDTLWLQTDEMMGGSECTDCGWLTVGGRGLCPACGESLTEVPDVFDAMAMSVRQHGGTVRTILAETPLSEHHVAASLRFPLRVSIS
ncbi:MAG: hypothetical protein HKN07_05120 [Acidimicrobiia bacterium]|nr:hypothetical protein [Acidimicrobiia bacterium]